MHRSTETREQATPSGGFVKRLCFGLVIGAASVTPGLSAGVIAAAAGLYEPSIRAIVNLLKQFRESVAYLLPLGLGIGVSVLAFSNVIAALMARSAFAVVYAFLGLVVGSLPSLVGEANAGGFQKRYLLATAVALGVVLCTEWLLTGLPGRAGGEALGAFDIVLYGGILAIGTIIPGISSSFILMYLGVYEPLITAIANVQLDVVMLLVVGFGLTALVIVKLIEALFRRFRGVAYYAVIGFLVGSMVMVFPGFRSGLLLAMDLVLFAVSAAISYMGMRLNSKLS